MKTFQILPIEKIPSNKDLLLFEIPDDIWKTRMKHVEKFQVGHTNEEIVKAKMYRDIHESNESNYISTQHIQKIVERFYEE